MSWEEPSVSERADQQAQLKNTWVLFEGFRLKSKVEKYWKWVGKLIKEVEGCYID